MTWRPTVLPPTPPPSREHVRLRFSNAGRKNTKPELDLRRRLHALGPRFLVDVAPPGSNRRRRADVVLRGAKVAVLVHGCFWHSCPQHLHLPTANREWWVLKLQSIVDRDADRLVELERDGWLPVVVWEHEDMDEAAARIAAIVADRNCQTRLGGS